MQHAFLAFVCTFALGVGLRSVFEFPAVVILWLMVIGFGFSLLWRRRS